MRHLSIYESFLSEELRGNPTIDRDLDPGQQEMVYGIIDLVQRVKDLDNRQEIADHLISTFKRDGISFDYKEFLRLCGLG